MVQVKAENNGKKHPLYYKQMKNIIIYIVLMFLIFTNFSQEKNVFLDRKFWKQNPSIEKIDSCIDLGNDISELNNYKFDPICWAILEEVKNTTIQYLLSKKGNRIVMNHMWM